MGNLNVALERAPSSSISFDAYTQAIKAITEAFTNIPTGGNAFKSLNEAFTEFNTTVTRAIEEPETVLSWDERTRGNLWDFTEDENFKFYVDPLSPGDFYRKDGTRWTYSEETGFTKIKDVGSYSEYSWDYRENRQYYVNPTASFAIYPRNYPYDEPVKKEEEVVIELAAVKTKRKIVLSDDETDVQQPEEQDKLKLIREKVKLQTQTQEDMEYLLVFIDALLSSKTV